MLNNIIKFPSKQEREKLADEKKTNTIIKRLLGEASKLKF